MRFVVLQPIDLSGIVEGRIAIIGETKPPRDYEAMDAVLGRGDDAELARLLSNSPQLVRALCRSPECQDIVFSFPKLTFFDQNFGGYMCYLGKVGMSVAGIIKDIKQLHFCYHVGKICCI